jgi:hypothetical protein
MTQQEEDVLSLEDSGSEYFDTAEAGPTPSFILLSPDRMVRRINHPLTTRGLRPCRYLPTRWARDLYYRHTREEAEAMGDFVCSGCHRHPREEVV